MTFLMDETTREEKEAEDEVGRTVLVGIKTEAGSRELLTWDLVNVAQTGDCIIALHVIRSSAEGNLITVSRKGRSSTARSGLKRGVGKAPSWSIPARTVPVLIPGSTIPKTPVNASKEPKSGAAKFGFSFFLFSLFTIALFF